MKRKREKRMSIKIIEKVRKGYCKKNNNQEVILKYFIQKTEDGFKFLKFDRDSYNRCNNCEQIEKCKLFKEM